MYKNLKMEKSILFKFLIQLDYDEFDAESNLVSKYIVKHTTSIYPPFSVYVEYQKFDVDGNLIEEKRV